MVKLNRENEKLNQKLIEVQDSVMSLIRILNMQLIAYAFTLDVSNFFLELHTDHFTTEMVNGRERRLFGEALWEEGSIRRRNKGREGSREAVETGWEGLMLVPVRKIVSYVIGLMRVSPQMTIMY